MGELMVTGRREILQPALVRQRIEIELGKLEPTEWTAVSGGAEGADTIFAEAALRLGFPLRLHLPNWMYREHYPRSVPDSIVSEAEVRYAVDRPPNRPPSVWRSEKWWTDNFVRNRSMVESAERALVVCEPPPAELEGGGTRHAFQEILKRGIPWTWIPDTRAES